MKAITVNSEIIVRSQIPNIWNNVHNYNSVNNTAQQIADGWRDVVEPSKTNYQKNGAIFYDGGNDNYTYAVVDFSAQEIIDYDQNVLDNDADSQLEDTHIVEGLKMSKRIKNAIRRDYTNAVITKTQFNGFKRNLRSSMTFLKEGEWDLAKEDLDALAVPSDPDVNALLTSIKANVDEYVTNSY